MNYCKLRLILFQTSAVSSPLQLMCHRNCSSIATQSQKPQKNLHPKHHEASYHRCCCCCLICYAAGVLFGSILLNTQLEAKLSLNSLGASNFQALVKWNGSYCKTLRIHESFFFIFWWWWLEVDMAMSGGSWQLSPLFLWFFFAKPQGWVSEWAWRMWWSDSLILMLEQLLGFRKAKVSGWNNPNSGKWPNVQIFEMRIFMSGYLGFWCGDKGDLL